MKILHTEASPGWGGQEIRILREAEGMRKRGHEVIIAPQKGGGLSIHAKKSGFRVYEIDYRKKRAFPCLYELLRILKAEKIDLINTHSSLDSWIGGIAARIKSIPIVRTRHLSTPVRKGLNSRFLYHALADFVVTTCSAIIPMLAKQSGKPLQNFRSIPTGVDTSLITFDPKEVSEFRKSLKLTPQNILIGTACFMRSWKGIDDLLQAADILRNNTQIKWVIIGGGHSEKYVKKAAELKLEGIVHFTGHLDNPFTAMASLDVFTLLSTAHEGVSQASLQAAFLGKPLLTTPVGGLSEVCLDKKTGIQVPPFSPKEVAEAVRLLVERHDLRKEWGANAQSLVLKKFTLDSMLDQMEEIFLSLKSRT